MNSRHLTIGSILALSALGAIPASAQVDWHGFVETGYGARTAESARFDDTKEYTLNETRVQFRASAYGDQGEIFVRMDVLGDQVADDGVKLDLREGFLRFTTLGDHLDVKAGRQALTWGTGDLIFINDLFPKDWVSFFIGREDQYLKAPVDAVRLGLFGLPFDLDVALVPEFTPDRLPTGERLSFYMPEGLAGPPVLPEDQIENGEVAVRLSRYVGNMTIALYGYHGFYKTPVAVDGVGMPFHPRLRVYGASARGASLGGVFWLEGGWYDSRDAPDPDAFEAHPGKVPMGFVPNSTGRYLAGFERQLADDFNATVQYYGEWMQNHDDYAANLPAGAYEQDEFRSLFTLRLEKWLHYQTIRLSFFGFWSPTDEDTHLRGLVSYKVSDEIEVAIGANVFEGNNVETQFGQFDENDNVFTRLRYSF